MFNNALEFQREILDKINQEVHEIKNIFSNFNQREPKLSIYLSRDTYVAFMRFGPEFHIEVMYSKTFLGIPIQLSLTQKANYEIVMLKPSIQPIAEPISEIELKQNVPYIELLDAVKNKVEGESRHETALRIIKQHEEANNNPIATGDRI